MKENERKNDKILSFLDEKYEILTKNPTEHRMDLSIWRIKESKNMELRLENLVKEFFASGVL